MAFMAPAPDQATYNSGGLSRSLSIPASYTRAMAMSSTDSMSPLSSLEKLMEPATQPSSAPPAAFTSRSATTSPTGSGYWGQDMVAMPGGAQVGVAAELLGGSGMVSSDWQALLDAKCAQQVPYKYLPPVSMAPAMRHGGIMENGRMREMLVGRVGVEVGVGGTGKSTAGAQSGKAWGAMEVAGAGITVDPSKGGLALQAVGLATSHCLAQFTSDPAFAERAAKFSSFGSAGKYPQIALPLPVNDGGCKSRSRSAESRGRLSRTSSNMGAAKKLAAAVAVEMEDKQAASAAAAQAAVATQAAAAVGATAAERSSCNVDMDVDGVNISDDKSPPGSAPAQPELEAIEGASLATMDHSTHEVDVSAAREPTNSCSAEQHQQQQQQRGGGTGSSPAASPTRSPSSSDDSDRLKRKNSPAAADKPHVDPKTADVVDSKPKRSKAEKTDDDAAKAKAERSCSDNSGDSGSPRAHKESTGSHKNQKDLSKQDYIHVRARRGQATDSHSLAERVRREKISERMKYLQDLVPGCSKVTGKAVMLDEIINYVQSLQRQVENLSMKLASVNPGPTAGRLDYSFETALNKEVLQSRLAGGSSLGAPESSATFGMLHHQQQQQQHHNYMLGSYCGLDFRSMGGSSSGVDGYLRRSNSAPIHVASGLTSVDTFGDDVSQSIGWGGELQSIVNQMGFGGHQGIFGSSILDGLHSQLPVGHMKVEM